MTGEIDIEQASCRRLRLLRSVPDVINSARVHHSSLQRNGNKIIAASFFYKAQYHRSTLFFYKNNFIRKRASDFSENKNS